MLANKLLSYYQNELSYLKKKGKIFAEQFPKIARRLGMSEGTTEGPHIERVIESFALVTAQIQQRLDEDMPEVTDALLTVLAPQLLRSFPSICIVEMTTDPKISALTASNNIAAGTELFTHPIDGNVCRFRTVYPVELQPITLTHASLHLDDIDMSWSLKVDLRVCPGGIFNAKSLRVFLNGSNSVVNIFYTLLCSEVKKLSLSCRNERITLPLHNIQAVGFQESEGLFSADSRISQTHALLQDYFYFPQKFHFIDLLLPEGFSAKSQDELIFDIKFNPASITRQLGKIADNIDADFFRLNCTPAINLFEQRAEPIAIVPQTAEYPVIPDIRHQDTIEVWSIDRVTAMYKQGSETVSRPIYPLFGLEHASQEGKSDIFWQSMRRENMTVSDSSSLLFVAFSDLNEKSCAPKSEIVSLNLTCTNRDVAADMRNGDPAGDFETELSIAGVKINALTRPTRSVTPPMKQAARWRLISHLSLNHMLITGPEGIRVLKETLALYNFHDNPTILRVINLLLNIEAKPIVARLQPHDPRSLARGIEIRITFAAAASQEVEYFLLCRFLECFLALYAPVNSFSRVITCIEGSDDSVREWPIRAGRLLWI